MRRWFLKLILGGAFSIGLALFIRSEYFSTYVVLPLLGEEAAETNPYDAIPVLLDRLAEQTEAQSAQSPQPEGEELEMLEENTGPVTITRGTEGGAGKRIRVNR